MWNMVSVHVCPRIEMSIFQTSHAIRHLDTLPVLCHYITDMVVVWNTAWKRNLIRSRLYVEILYGEKSFKTCNSEKDSPWTVIETETTLKKSRVSYMKQMNSFKYTKTTAKLTRFIVNMTCLLSVSVIKSVQDLRGLSYAK